MSLAAEFAARLLVPPGREALDVARLRIFDTLGALVAGQSVPATRALGDVHCVLGKEGLVDKVRYACASVRCTEVDDIHLASCTTPGSLVVPVALLVGATREVDDRVMLEGVVAGYEAMASVGRAIDGPHRLREGVWPTLVGAPLAAAATAARILDLDDLATAHALAIAAGRVPAGTGRIVGDLTSRWFAFGCAGADGVLAALAAERGMLGDLNSLEPALPHCGEDANTNSLVYPRERPAIEDVDIKPVCTARQTLAAVEAVRSAAVPPDQIEQITVLVPGAYRQMLDRPKPTDRLASIASAQYQTAVAAAAPDRLYGIVRENLYSNSMIQDLMTRVEVTEDATLTTRYPAEWGARIRLETINGAVIQREVRHPHGCATRPLNWNDVLQKNVRLNGSGSEWARIGQRCRLLGDSTETSAFALLDSTLNSTNHVTTEYHTTNVE